ncbi:MAG: DUF4230 domain-containing protein [Candidatus Dojkabacteria bacterium]
MSRLSLPFFIFYSISLVIITTLLTILSVLLLDRLLNSDGVEIESEVVFDRVTEQSFLVTTTVYTDQSAEIRIDEGTPWSNFFWGKTVVAEGSIRSDLGFDLSAIEEDQVEIDEGEKLITISGLDLELLDASVTSDLEIEERGSILRRLLKNERNEDFELAEEQLTAAAVRVVLEDEELVITAEENAEGLLSGLFIEEGYSVEIELD